MAKPNNDEKSFLTVTRHEEYYIPSADLSIMVDHIQFKVHRYFFERESKYFSSRLALPTATSPGSPLQGSDDSNSIILENVTPDQFARFLWVFYNPKHSIFDASLEEWESILILSTLWQFPEVKNLAIRELEKKDMLDVQRIKLYHDNNVDRNILIPRYAALIERERTLTADEGRDLGFETAMMIAAAREEARSSRLPSGMRSPLSPTIHGADLHEVIRELFKIAPGGPEPEVETTHTTEEALASTNGHAAGTSGTTGTKTTDTQSGHADDKKGKGGHNGANTDKDDTPKTGGTNPNGTEELADLSKGKGRNNKNNNNKRP